MRRFIVFLATLLLTAACTGGYTFTGASIPPEAKTISIKQFPNHATTVNPQLSQNIYDELQRMFSTQTSLNVINDDGDLHIEGQITDYSTRASSIGTVSIGPKEP